MDTEIELNVPSPVSILEHLRLSRDNGRTKYLRM